ncbi:MAG: phosphotransferase family protein [Acidobacteriota bacterium]|jgi:aminoglycoside phosphotransferase (APT) family kinase protein
MRDDPPTPRTPIDRPAPVRAGEELDREALLAYLRARPAGPTGGPTGRGDTPPVERLEIEQFPAGYSNLTYLVRLIHPEGSRELVLRRPPFGSDVATAHDMAREHRILSALQGVYPKAPRPLLYCDDPSVLGAPFYLMERVRGVILRGGPGSGSGGGSGPESGPESASNRAPGDDARRSLTEAFVDAFAELHAVDTEAAGLSGLGRPEGYVERQVRGWAERYRAARTEDVAEVERTADWLIARLGERRSRPAGPPPAALIHNDFKLDNLVLTPESLAPDGASGRPEILAVLDWEMATVGDPLMDLGSSLAYWIAADDPAELRLAPVPRLTAEPGSLSRREVVERYERRTGRTVDDPVFYYAYGQLKLAGILQQIYARYHRGATSDPRFAGLPPLIRACGRAAERAVRRERIDRLTS